LGTAQTGGGTGGGVVDPAKQIASLVINKDTQIAQSQHIQTLNVPEPSWVFIVRDGMMVCGTEETASDVGFPRKISIASLDYGAQSKLIHAIAVPLAAGNLQRLDKGCYSPSPGQPGPDKCALCIACQYNVNVNVNAMGCCVGPTYVEPTPPTPCSF